MSDANTFVSTLWRNGILGDALGTLASVVLLFAKVLAERGQYPSGEQCRNPRNWGNCLWPNPLRRVTCGHNDKGLHSDSFDELSGWVLRPSSMLPMSMTPTAATLDTSKVVNQTPERCWKKNKKNKKNWKNCWRLLLLWSLSTTVIHRDRRCYPHIHNSFIVVGMWVTRRFGTVGNLVGKSTNNRPATGITSSDVVKIPAKPSKKMKFPR